MQAYPVRVEESLMDDNQSHHKVALVTGGARRVGAEMVRALHACGYRMAIHYRQSQSEAQKLTAELNACRPNSAACFEADLREDTAPESLIRLVIQQFDRLDGLINNASSFYPTPFGQIQPQDWEELAASNLKTPLFLAQAAAPALKKTGGAIVNLIDIHAERPLRHYAAYNTAKAGLLGLTRSLALELAPEIRVNGIAPGAILWPEDQQFSPEMRSAILKQIPLSRMGTPKDVAEVAVFLIHEAHYLTGQILNVDGGRSLFL